MIMIWKIFKESVVWSIFNSVVAINHWLHTMLHARIQEHQNLGNWSTRKNCIKQQWKVVFKYSLSKYSLNDFIKISDGSSNLWRQLGFILHVVWQLHEEQWSCVWQWWQDLHQHLRDQHIVLQTDQESTWWGDGAPEYRVNQV